jgi:uncharacterized protein YceH (UPF0502 family)
MYHHNVPYSLTEIEARILGALIEKEITTPEYYPLSLNALVNACNQKSNRHPEMHLDDDAVLQSLRTLEQKGLAGKADNMESRVKKYEHRLADAFNFNRLETAILCELLLRGPQTPGELRSRAERMHHFDDLDAVLSTLRHLIERDPPLAELLPRQPGTKEARYTHLLSGDAATTTERAPAPALTHNADPANSAPPTSATSSPSSTTKSVIAFPSSANSPAAAPAFIERIANLEQKVSILQQEIADLKQQLANFRKQFE